MMTHANYAKQKQNVTSRKRAKLNLLIRVDTCVVTGFSAVKGGKKKEEKRKTREKRNRKRAKKMQNKSKLVSGREKERH